MTPAPDRPVIAPADAPASPTAALAALATYRHLRAGTDALTDPTPAEEAVLLRTAREAARLGARAGLTEQAAEVIKTTTAHLRSPAAQGWRERGAKHYGKMILLAVRMNRHADALDLYSRAGRFLKLDPSLRRGLAEAAVGLGRTDLGAARLYADALADGPTSPEMRALLRPALRIDLTTPPAAALAEIEALNETVRLADASAWASAHLAVAALRRGRAADARRLRDEARAAAALDRTTDVDTAARLGLVSYLCRDWQAAEELFRAAAAPFYLPLARAGRLLNDPKAAEDADAFRRDLAAAAAELGRGAGFQPAGTIGRLEAGPTPNRDTAAELGRGAGFQPAGTTGRLETGPTPEYAAETTRSADEPGPALDAVRVRGAALAVLGQDAEAAAVFATAPVEYLTWRTVRPEAEVLARLGAPISPRLAEQAPALGQLLDATAALDRLDLPALRAAVAGLGGPAAEQPWFDADPPAVAACLRGELALTDPRPLATPPEAPEDVSAGVRAWAARLAARWHLERGETGEARRLLADPVHWIAAAEARQLDAVVRDVSGDDAGAALEVAAKAPAAPAPHALAFGLWLCGRGRYADARAAFEPLPVELRESVEVRLALARGELADDPERARERLRGFLDGDEPARAVWVNAPRLALNRPWHQRVPIALWSLPADVSLHRVGDVLEAVELFLAAGQPEPAARTLALAEELLGKLLPDLAPQVGDGYRRLALADLARNDIEGACRRHDRAADLRAGDPEFPAKLAAALAEAPAAPDVALRVLCEAAADFRGTTTALDATELAATVRRVLAIEAATPADAAELDRRRRWTRTLAEKRADWDWPKRNLARDAARGGKPDEVLAHVGGVAAPEGADHLLSGHAAWALRRFAAAAGAFDRAVEAGAGLPDARAWRGVARAAERFATDTPTALASEEADALLTDLDPAACTAELAPTARTWSGAVAVAAGRAEVALAALDPAQTAPDDHVPVGVLRGVGFALAGRDAEALGEWGDDATASPWGVAFRALSLARQRDPAEARAAALALRRAGADARLVALAEAQVKLGEGTRPEPVVGLGAKDCPPLLLALRPLLDAEREFVAARRLQHEGRFADAAAALDAVAPRRLWPAAARVWRAACLAEAGNAADARVAFEALTAAPDVAADAHANLALLAVRGGDPDAAERSAANAAAHPLARLARGEIADARGRADVARTTFAELADDAAADPVGRVRAAAALAAGRLAQNAGQPDQAERRYRQALALRPGWPAAAERLGLLLAVTADDEERLEEAAALFPTGDGTDATVVLAQAVVGERLGRVDQVAERLDHLIRLPGFDRLPPDLRHGVAKWSAGVRLRRGDYRAAAAALERVWREEPTAAVEDQLVRCRLLQADGAVKQLPIPDGAIEEAAAAAEDVLARRPGDRLALLIATACGLLLKHENTRAAALGAVEWATDGERLAAAALRLLSGEGGATADIDRYAAAGPAGAARTLALLSASLAKNPEPFADAAAQLADAPDADGLPFDPEGVVLVGALDRVSRDQHAKAAKWLDRWHAAPNRGTDGSKRLHAFLLGREAGQILKTDLNGAADLLTRAIKLLPQAGEGNVILSADARLTDAGQAALLAALRVTLARKVEPEHVLIALLDDAASPLTRECARLKPTLDVVSLRDTLIATARGSGAQPAVASWANDLLAPRAAEALAAAGAPAEATAEVRVRLFAAAALGKAKNSVRNTFTYSGVDAAELGRALEAPPPAAAAVPDAFTADGELNRDAFDAPARAVLRLLETEGKGLGLQRVNTPLLLFALVGRENGLLDRGLRVQAVDPRAIHQHLQLHLRALGKGVLADALPLRRTTMPLLVAEVFEAAVRLAGDMGLPAAGEGELVRGLLLAGDPFVASTLATYKVDVKALSEFAANRASGEEEASDEWTIPPIEEVEERLRTRVVGQGHVVDAIMPMLKRLRFGYTRRGRPMGVLLFLGTSGTGKTLLAKEIARAVYGSEDKLIFLEMGQFGTEYSKTMFIGAPPGLVGYGEGLLTNGIRDKPESVVLFDEVEKAHKSVFDVLLRFLDEGQIADPAGPIRDGRKCVLVLTSNHALDVLRPVIDRQTAAAGHLTPALRDQIRTEARAAILQTEFFRPEFLNRVDDILLFNTFGPDTYRLIVLNLIKEESGRFREEKDLDVSADEELVDYLVELCVARSDEGARVCGRLVSQFFVGPLIDFFVVDANRRHRAARVVMTERVGEVEVVPGGAS